MEAVRCALDFQARARQENDNLVQSRQMHFRVGITIGDGLATANFDRDPGGLDSIVGAIVGNWLLGLIGIGLGGLIGQLVVAILGACVLIFVYRAIKGRA